MSLSLKYGDAIIVQAPSMKLLGLHLNKRLRFGLHIGEALKKARTALRTLHSSQSGLCTKNKVTLYKLFVRPVMTYRMTVWNNASKTNIDHVQVTQNKALRGILNLFPDPISFRQVSNKRIHEICDIERMDSFMKRMTHNCYVKMLDHTNGLIRGMTDASRHATSVRSVFNVIRDLIWSSPSILCFIRISLVFVLFCFVLSEWCVFCSNFCTFKSTESAVI